MIRIYWDCSPKCPYCNQQQEAAFGLEEDGEWQDIECLNCKKCFMIKPNFELNCDIAKKENLNATKDNS